MKTRLDKALVHMGLCTRSETKKLIRQGRISVDGQPAERADQKVEEGCTLAVDDTVCIYQELVYLMLNKPAGVISATEGQEETVLDLIDLPVKDLFPVGRLDKDTTGLLLLSNDGPLAHQLLSPRHHVEKEYEVTLKKPVSAEDIRRIEEGISDGEDTFLPAEYIPLDETHGRIILSEGKYHEIKRIFQQCENEVIALKRIRMKNLVLDESLAPGEYRPLTEEEIRGLKN
jgi:16S rRNA pseudouridine516 synthase